MAPTTRSVSSGKTGNGIGLLGEMHRICASSARPATTVHRIAPPMHRLCARKRPHSMQPSRSLQRLASTFGSRLSMHWMLDAPKRV